jgi:hypothetical protein
MNDDLLRRLRELNPVPDPDRFVGLGGPDWPADPALRAVLEQAATTNHRPRTIRLGPERDLAPKERAMPTLTPPRNDDNTRPEHRSRRGWLLAAAAAIAVVVLAVGGLFTMLGSMFNDVVIAPAATDTETDAEIVPEVDAEQATIDQAIETAQAYIDARNAYDADRARTLVAGTFTTSEVPDAYTLDTMRLAFQTHEAYGFHYSEGDCELHTPRTPVGGQVAVWCDYLWTTELQRITDHPPVPVGFVFRVGVEDGLIASIGHDWNPDEFMPNVYDPWIAFLGRHDPVVRMNALATHELDPERTRAFIRQAPEYLALYEEWVNEQEH